MILKSFPSPDNGVSGEVQQRPADAGVDRLSSLESKLAQLERNTKPGEPGEKKNKAMLNGREACMFYNTKGKLKPQ